MQAKKKFGRFTKQKRREKGSREGAGKGKKRQNARKGRKVSILKKKARSKKWRGNVLNGLPHRWSCRGGVEKDASRREESVRWARRKNGNTRGTDLEVVKGQKKKKGGPPSEEDEERSLRSSGRAK